jgi:maltose alpha-D-glucosyltransferase/alpha-amylase
MTNSHKSSENGSIWYKNAVIYELHVRSFSDSDADGVGDFPGLINKLDYLEDLGVNAVWLLPFYPSPLKDDGYDISDYLNIQPAYGDMSQFKAFINEAHRRGIRVITELVINHTSDQHPWFQRARKARKGSQARDFYVWSDTPDKYSDARIIFTDTEKSNWAWDSVAKQYYWHRFYSHQPDLNFNNPEVREAIFKVMDYWLEMGVDGLRVDAVPYLYEREGTSCENLPETHAFIKELRAHIDNNFDNRMLLAEANQWPEDAVAYFGNGDEFHMAFHFPIMPRLFMALSTEDRFPIIDIIRQTPAIPEKCQWVLFLRNHDELTLEMVTDEERDYMYRVYAADPAARLNLGIRRRLAPLLGNSRRKIELINSLLFSLTGTPIIYYGDEIGMGDNFYLGDRNGVRTPMQWSPERNAGFSQANPQKLFLPPIIDPEYHYEAINVENQMKNPDSLLWWMKRLITMYKRYPAFGRGTLEFLPSENRRVLTYLRSYGDEHILVVANLSHASQQTQLDLSRFNGYRPVDLFEHVEFDAITEEEYYFTLSPYSFYWFSLEQRKEKATPLHPVAMEKSEEIPVINKTGKSLLENKENWFILEAMLLNYVQGQRWYRGKAREAWAVEIQDVISLGFEDSNAYLTLFRVEYSEGEPDIYSLPLMFTPEKNNSNIIKQYPNAIVAWLHVRGKAAKYLLYDATIDRDFNSFMLSAVKSRRNYHGLYGTIIPDSTAVLRRYSISELNEIKPSPVKAEQSNTSIIYGDRFILKLYRKLEYGINPDVEVGRYLTQHTSFANVPGVAGSLEYRVGRRQLASLAVLHNYMPNEGDAWQYTLNTLERYYAAVITHPTVQSPPMPSGPLLSLPNDPPSLAKETIGSYLTSVQILGQRTAELHIALSDGDPGTEFSAEPYTLIYQTSLYQSLRGAAIRTLQSLRELIRYLPEESQKDARTLLDLEKTIIDRYALIPRKKITAARIRCHGDYHLGQVLYTGKDFVITDFEGEPARPISERRFKRSPLKDVAGMIRSFDYAASEALARQLAPQQKLADTPLILKRWAQYWHTWVSVVYLNSYLDTIRKADLLPKEPEPLKVLLDAFILEKALYEVSYELNNRPDWINIPLRGILNILEIDK